MARQWNTMTPSELDRIEEVLGITLPEAYRATMGVYPFDSDATASDCMLPNDAEWVINANRGLDRHFLLHHGKGRWVPTKNHLLIGTDGGEEYYYLDLREKSCPVLAFDLETGNLSVFCDNFERFVCRCREIDDEIEEDERKAAERAEGRKWWQFWSR
jgi:hypothetical protein